MSDPQEIKDILDGLEEPTADDVYHETRVYDVRYLASAAAAVAKAGGGGGGSVPESLLVLTSVPVSSAEILALNTAAKELLPAPGGRLYYVLHKVVVHYRFNTIPYTNDGGAGYVNVGYGPGLPDYYVMTSSAAGGPTLSGSDLLVASEDVYCDLVKLDADATSSAMWAADEIENQPIVLYLGADGGEGVLDGDGTFTVRVWYSLIDGAPA